MCISLQITCTTKMHWLNCGSMESAIFNTATSSNFTPLILSLLGVLEVSKSEDHQDFTVIDGPQEQNNVSFSWQTDSHSYGQGNFICSIENRFVHFVFIKPLLGCSRLYTNMIYVVNGEPWPPCLFHWSFRFSHCQQATSSSNRRKKSSNCLFRSKEFLCSCDSCYGC